MATLPPAAKLFLPRPCPPPHRYLHTPPLARRPALVSRSRRPRSRNIAVAFCAVRGAARATSGVQVLAVGEAGDWASEVDVDVDESEGEGEGDAYRHGSADAMEDLAEGARGGV
ncbi:hypothetical protein K505DRAFT_380833 [Melanomma pulvis-pyrius CBS 109.77]|uniref:Uncharacterized protein n=1 Tax=Melanomma pulvis-pyrius CBS 109.77 TaxID=1314802 RepID=A0A6A6WN96_9PLEO|nr:hypothetical protein K505DRAFT_380833 [Melanomma pulvis-pyrius CBS 109.77]